MQPDPKTFVRFLAEGGAEATNYLMPPLQGRFPIQGNPRIHIAEIPFTSTYAPTFDIWNWDQDRSKSIARRAEDSANSAKKAVGLSSSIQPRIPKAFKIEVIDLWARTTSVYEELGIHFSQARELVRWVVNFREWQQCERFAASLLNANPKRCLELIADDPEVTVSVLGLDPSLVPSEEQGSDASKREFVLGVGYSLGLARSLSSEEISSIEDWDELLTSEPDAGLRKLLTTVIQKRSEIVKAHCLLNGWESACYAEEIVGIVAEVDSARKLATAPEIELTSGGRTSEPLSRPHSSLNNEISISTSAQLVRFYAEDGMEGTSYLKDPASGNPRIHTAVPYTWGFDPKFDVWDQDSTEKNQARAQAAMFAATEPSRYSRGVAPRLPRQSAVGEDVLNTRVQRMVKDLKIEGIRAVSIVKDVIELRRWQECAKFAKSLIDADPKKCLELVVENPEITVCVLGLDSSSIPSSGQTSDSGKVKFVKAVGQKLSGKRMGRGRTWDALRNLDRSADVRGSLAAAISERATLTHGICIANGWDIAVELEILVGEAAKKIELPNRIASGASR